MRRSRVIRRLHETLERSEPPEARVFSVRGLLAKIVIALYTYGMRTMNVSLPDGLDDYVHELIDAGNYTSASEVVRDGLRLLRQRNAALKTLPAEIQEGLAELDRGASVSLKDAAKRLRAHRARKSKARG